MISEDADVIAAFLAVGIEVIPPDRDLFPPGAGEWTVTRISTSATFTTGFPAEFADQAELDAFIAFLDAQL